MIEGVSSGACQGLWEPEEEVLHGLNSTTPGRRTETLSEHPRLDDLGGYKTLSECHNVD